MSEVILYTWLQWSGPGRSHVFEDLREPGPYAQTHRVHARVWLVPDWLEELAREAHSTLDRMTVVGWIKSWGRPQ